MFVVIRVIREFCRVVRVVEVIRFIRVIRVVRAIRIIRVGRVIRVLSFCVRTGRRRDEDMHAPTTPLPPFSLLHHSTVESAL